MTSRMMAAVHSKNTRPELLLRHELHHRGMRYRLHAKTLPGRPDIVFTRYRLAVFVDGDMWHGNAHRLRGLANLADMFPTKTEWWVEKIEANMRRDERATAQLTAAGWRVLRLWESDVLASPSAAADQVQDALSQAGWKPPC